jgi:hypothetical protein
MERLKLACIDFTTENHHRIANASFHDRTILSVIVDNFVLSIFDVIS